MCENELSQDINEPNDSQGHMSISCTTFVTVSCDNIPKVYTLAEQRDCQKFKWFCTSQSTKRNTTCSLYYINTRRH